MIKQKDKIKNSILKTGIILAVLAVACMAMVGAGAADTHTHDGKTFDTAVDHNNIASFLASGGSGYLTEDITGNFTVNSSEAVQLCLNGHAIFGKNSNPVITVGPSCNLNLYNCKENGVIADGDAYYGGGICIGDGSTVTMKNGTITNCSATYGGGVYIGSGAQFTLENGTISNCTAGMSGAGVHGVNGTFTMKNGKITQCQSTGGNFNGGGVCLYETTFTMTGGSITYCGGQENIEGGGLYIYNQSTPQKTVTMSNGASISHCSAVNGGGVYLDEGILTMENGTSISNCSASNFGGGVFIENGTLSIKGGSITNCIADYGAAIFNSDGTIKTSSAQNNATVLGSSNDGENTASDESGGTVIITEGTVEGEVVNDSTMKIGGTAKVEDIYLKKGKKITLMDGGDKLTEGAKIGIRLEDPTDNRIFDGMHNPEFMKEFIRNKIIECKNPGKHFEIDDNGNIIIITDFDATPHRITVNSGSHGTGGSASPSVARAGITITLT